MKSLVFYWRFWFAKENDPSNLIRIFRMDKDRTICGIIILFLLVWYGLSMRIPQGWFSDVCSIVLIDFFFESQPKSLLFRIFTFLFHFASMTKCDSHSHFEFITLVFNVYCSRVLFFHLHPFLFVLLSHNAVIFSVVIFLQTWFFIISGSLLKFSLTFGFHLTCNHFERTNKCRKCECCVFEGKRCFKSQTRLTHTHTYFFIIWDECIRMVWSGLFYSIPKCS